MTAAHEWFYWALLSAVFAALMAIFAKLGLAGIDVVSSFDPGDPMYSSVGAQTRTLPCLQVFRGEWLYGDDTARSRRAGEALTLHGRTKMEGRRPALVRDRL
jgi:hypothetical protein